mgnify:CR=1 FL=1
MAVGRSLRRGRVYRRISRRLRFRLRLGLWFGGLAPAELEHSAVAGSDTLLGLR